MRLKISILTILVGALSVLSFYLVYSDQKAEADIALTELFLNEKDFNSQRAFLLPISEPTYFPIRDTSITPPELSAKSFLIYDSINGKIIFSKDPGRALPVASLTKLLTAVVALENLDPQEVITITHESFNVDGQGADFHIQEQLYFKDLLGAMLVKSSNDAAMTIAKAVEQKTGQKFTDLMNNKAFQIGMDSSNFLDPAGLNDEGYSSSRDLLRLVHYTKHYPLIHQFTGLSSLKITSAEGKFAHNFNSTNKLWGILPGLTGGKTGYTDGALGCMITEENLSAQNSSLVIIILGSADRFGEIKQLSDWAKLAFRWR
ncbi:MAG: serine hydrolase [bacterium]|nr:serine hydrolase [bacterium]